MIIFDFNNKESVSGWFSINDGVMGGISEGKISHGTDGMIFHGNVSFENNGGFASVRSKDFKIDLSNFSGLLIEAEGDGKIYKLNTRNSGLSSSINFQQKFETGGKIQKYYFPFTEFSANRRGIKVPLMKLDPSKIISFGFMISDKQEGEFRLTVKSISAY